jgi:recombination protein U
MLWYHKIADPTFGGDVTGGRAVDVVACYDGIFIGMEWKLKKDDRAFPIKRVRDGQVATLCDIEVAGGVGLLMIAKYKGPKDKCVYIIPIAQWNSAVRMAIKDGRKSVRVEELFENCRTGTQRTGAYTHWDMQFIERMVHRVIKDRNRN